MKRLFRGYLTPALHALVWLLLLAIPTIIFRNRQGNFLGLTHDFFLLSSLFHIGVFYLNAYLLYPSLLTRRKWPLYLIAIAVLIFLSNKCKIFLLQLDPSFQLTEDNRRVIFFSIVPFIVASILYRLISDRNRFERLEKEARAQRLDAELKFLRSQVSPHFLFNMLTNMVALARQKSDQLEPSLIQLSELLRYMLYDSTESKIDVEKEIKTIENYVSLQQLRFGEDVRITLNVDKQDPDCPIESMLLVPFIENAFKHGVGMVRDPFIEITVKVQNKVLVFECRNNYNSTNHSKDGNSGIGLANVKSRLELLYPGKHMLEIDDRDQIFSVRLKLELS